MRLNFNFFYAFLAIPAFLAYDGQSCKTDIQGFDGYGFCTSFMYCMPDRCGGGRKRCINNNYSIYSRGSCPDGEGVCCIKTVKVFNNQILPIPGRCLNKANCDSEKYRAVSTWECPGEDVVLCIPNDPNNTVINETGGTPTTIVPGNLILPKTNLQLNPNKLQLGKLREIYGGNNDNVNDNVYGDI